GKRGRRRRGPRLRAARRRFHRHRGGGCTGVLSRLAELSPEPRCRRRNRGSTARRGPVCRARAPDRAAGPVITAAACRVGSSGPPLARSILLPILLPTPPILSKYRPF